MEDLGSTSFEDTHLVFIHIKYLSIANWLCFSGFYPISYPFMFLLALPQVSMDTFNVSDKETRVLAAKIPRVSSY